MIAPKYEALSNQYPNVTFLKVNVDDSGDIAQEAGITAMPTFKGFKNGQLFDTLQGANEMKLVDMIKKINDQ